jgi:hypothetical protein
VLAPIDSHHGSPPRAGAPATFPESSRTVVREEGRFHVDYPVNTMAIDGTCRRWAVDRSNPLPTLC